jgi:hypothetical protein
VALVRSLVSINRPLGVGRAQAAVANELTGIARMTGPARVDNRRSRLPGRPADRCCRAQRGEEPSSVAVLTCICSSVHDCVLLGRELRAADLP